VIALARLADAGVDLTEPGVYGGGLLAIVVGVVLRQLVGPWLSARVDVWRSRHLAPAAADVEQAAKVRADVEAQQAATVTLYQRTNLAELQAVLEQVRESLATAIEELKEVREDGRRTRAELNAERDAHARTLAELRQTEQLLAEAVRKVTELQAARRQTDPPTTIGGPA